MCALSIGPNAAHRIAKTKGLPRRTLIPSQEPHIFHRLSAIDCQPSLNAKRAAAAASALHIRVIELESGAFNRFDVVNLDAFQVH